MTEVNRSTSFKKRIGRGVAGLLLAASVQFAHADAPQPSYVMTVIADEAEGQKMIAGDYAEAIAGITTPKGRQRSSFSVSNNLCVAYTKTNDLSNAEEACANALRVSRVIFNVWYESPRKRRDHAVALSNRGVIRAITGDVDGARSDFEQARKLNDSLAAAAENLARLQRQEAPTVSSL